jgi:hypothetical protein
MWRELKRHMLRSCIKTSMHFRHEHTLNINRKSTHPVGTIGGSGFPVVPIVGYPQLSGHS